MQLLDGRLHQIINFCNEHGDNKTAQHFGINHETLGRYKREHRIRNGSTEPQATISPRVLILDVETAPIQCFVWSTWKQNINSEQIIRDWSILTWSVKWLNDNEVFYGAVTPDEAIKGQDKRIMKELWAFVEEADVIVAHNGINFDFKRMNTRFILNDIKPPLSYQVIDTLQLSKKKFAFTYNKLDFIASILGFGEKLKTNFDLWKLVVRGEQDAIDEMVAYNKRDVTLLEEVYHVLGVWMPSHPNLGLNIEDNHTMCPFCTSEDLTWKGYYATLVGKYSTARCNHCGFISRSRHNELSKGKRELLNVSIAR